MSFVRRHNVSESICVCKGALRTFWISQGAKRRPMKQRKWLECGGRLWVCILSDFLANLKPKYHNFVAQVPLKRRLFGLWALQTRKGAFQCAVYIPGAITMYLSHLECDNIGRAPFKRMICEKALFNHYEMRHNMQYLKHLIFKGAWRRPRASDT